MSFLDTTSCCEITLPLGVHARNATRLVRFIQNCECSIQIESSGAITNGLNILELLILLAEGGETISISSDQEQAATIAIAEHIQTILSKK